MTLTCSLPYISFNASSSTSFACSCATKPARRASAFCSALDVGGVGEDRPEAVGDVLPLLAGTGSPVFSIAFAAVFFVPASASSFCAGVEGLGGVDVVPKDSTFPPPADFSTFGAAAVPVALSESVLTGAAAPVPLDAAGLGAWAAGCCCPPEGNASPRLAIMGVCRW